MDSKRYYFILIVGVISVGMLLTGGTYAWLAFGTTVGSNTQESESTCFSMNYEGVFDVGDLFFDLNGDGVLDDQDVTYLQGYMYAGNSSLFPGTREDYPISDEVLQRIDDDNNGDINSIELSLFRITIEEYKSYVKNTLFPSKTDKGGLQGKVTFSIKEECNVNANGYIKLNIGADTASRYFMNSALRYSVYDSDNSTLIESGLLTTYGVKTLNQNNPITLTKTDTTYYVYVWLDGTKADNSYLNLPFSATMYASAVQVEL